MHDVIFLGVFAGFMLLSFGYVRLCERIVGQPAPEKDGE